MGELWRSLAPRTWGRFYFALQAVAGAVWWVGVFTVPWIRTATLGALDAPLIAAVDIPLFVVASAVAASGVRSAVWVAASWTVLVSAAMVVYATMTGAAGWGALLMTAAALGSIGAAVLVLTGRVPSEWMLVGPFRFRTASSARPVAHVTRTAMQILAFTAIFLVAIPAVLAFLEVRWGVHLVFPPALRVAGVVLFAASFSFSMWAAAAMSVKGGGTPLPAAMPRRLVIVGPYRFVRNPMAIGGIAQGVAVGLAAGSWIVVAYALCGSLVWNFLVRPHEEADLEARFGDEFRVYRDRVACWVPRRPPGAA